MKISVIIPVYNKARYLNNLLSDLLKQTFTGYECILIDDGSNDDSGQLCDNISKIDNRFRTFHLINCGVSNARNYGICQSEGDYITFVDADDRLYPQYLENLYKCITENNVEFVISGLEKYWTDSDRKEFIKYPYNGIKTKKEILSDFAQVQQNNGIFGYSVGKIFKKDLATGIEFDTSVKLAEDFDFYLKIYKRVNTFYFDDKCYYRYLQVTDGSTSIINDDKIDYLSQLKIRLRYRQFLMDEAVYSGDNRQIIDETISNYVYFVLFHSSLQRLYNNYSELKKVIGDERLIISNKSFFQRWIITLYENNNKLLIKYSLATYRLLAKIARKLRK